MTVEECKELVESYHDATNRGDLDALDKIFAKDFINEAAGFDPVRGSEDMKLLIRELLDAFPDWHVYVEDISAKGTKWLCAGDLPQGRIKVITMSPPIKSGPTETIEVDPPGSCKVSDFEPRILAIFEPTFGSWGCVPDLCVTQLAIDFLWICFLYFPVRYFPCHRARLMCAGVVCRSCVSWGLDGRRVRERMEEQMPVPAVCYW